MGQTWGGSVDEFLQFQRIAYTVAKSANPNAVIHLAGFTYWWDVNYNRVPFFQAFPRCAAKRSQRRREQLLL